MQVSDPIHATSTDVPVPACLTLPPGLCVGSTPAPAAPTECSPGGAQTWRAGEPQPAAVLLQTSWGEGACLG